MDQGVAKHVVGVPYNTAKINKRDSLFLSIWSGGGYTNRNKSM